MTDSTERNETTPDETERLEAEPQATERLETVLPSVEQAAPAAPPATGRPPVRMSTVVWGLIITVVGAGILARALGAEFDNELALIVLLCTAGVALVATSIVSAVRKK